MMMLWVGIVCAGEKAPQKVIDLARWFITFLDKLQDTIRGITKDFAEVLQSLSEEISGFSSQMSEGDQNMSSKSDSVAAAAEEMSTNMTSAAGEMANSSSQVNLSAEALKKLTHHTDIPVKGFIVEKTSKKIY